MPTFYPGQTDYLDQLNALVALTGPGSGQFLAGTAGAPSITFATSTQSGWYLDAVNQPALATSGVRRLYVTAAGILNISSGATITGNFTTAGPTNAVNIASDQTTGILNFGSASGTGTITLGQSTGAQTVGVGIGVTTSGTTKTLNIGTGGASGSVTNITLGSSTGTNTTTIWGPIVSAATPNSNWALDFASSTSAPSYITLAAAATYDLAVGSGIVVIHSNINGSAGVFITYAGVTAKIAGATDIVSGTGTTSQIGLAYNAGTNKYRINNGYTTSQSIWITTIRTRALS